MTVSLNNSLASLSLLTGGNAFSTTSGVTYESKAVRTAKALFTTEATTPPWKEKTDDAPVSSQVAAIQALKTIIDKDGTGVDEVPADVQTAFTTYKALDRLRTLANLAAAATTSDAKRAQLQTTFAKGLADLQSYLTTAPSDLVNISFGKPLQSVKSATITDPNQYAVSGGTLVKNRTDAIKGMSGSEQISITLSKPGATDQVSIDLSQGAQPPTIDSVVNQLNAAIQSVQLKNADGTPKLDANGQPMPRYQVKFSAVRNDDGWGIKLDAPSGVERVSLQQTNAKDSIIVATGQTAKDSPTATNVFRYDDPTGDMAKKTMGTIKALDRVATEQATLIGKVTETITTVSTDYAGKETTNTAKTSNVYADTDAAAIATDVQGYSYIVGTAQGDLGANRSDGNDNLFLTKMDSEGNVVWQRSLGAAGSSQGAAVTVGADGSVVVAGTVNGSFDGATTDGDMVVAKYSANGDEKFATVVRNTGSESARAVAVGADGSVYVGGRSATGSGDAYLARIDGSGKLAERRTIDMGGSDSINALAIDGNGDLLALVNHSGQAEVRRIDGQNLSSDLGSIQLGSADARVLAVASDGSIAVGGATQTALNGTQVNAASGARDGFVTRIDAGLSSASTTYIGTSADDQVDSLSFLGGDLYVGGRTTGDLGATKKGVVDGFVARLDAASGAIENTTQFGSSSLTTEPVRVAASAGGASSLGALGFERGTINPETSAKLTTQTALRPGDSFSLKLDGGTVKKITITKDDTLATLAAQISKITGSAANVTTPKSGDSRGLAIYMKAGHSLELIAGPDGSDALPKLGIEPQRISAPATKSDDDPKVTPGGTFGLALSNVLNLKTQSDSAYALSQLEGAVSMSQTAYRSLYWDDTKALLVDGGTKNAAYGTHSTAIEKAQLANYQAALSRLSTTNTTTGFLGF